MLAAFRKPWTKKVWKENKVFWTPVLIYSVTSLALAGQFGKKNKTRKNFMRAHLLLLVYSVGVVYCIAVPPPPPPHRSLGLESCWREENGVSGMEDAPSGRGWHQPLRLSHSHSWPREGVVLEKVCRIVPRRHTMSGAKENNSTNRTFPDPFIATECLRKTKHLYPNITITLSLDKHGLCIQCTGTQGI